MQTNETDYWRWKPACAVTPCGVVRGEDNHDVGRSQNKVKAVPYAMLALGCEALTQSRPQLTRWEWLILILVTLDSPKIVWHPFLWGFVDSWAVVVGESNPGSVGYWPRSTFLSDKAINQESTFWELSDEGIYQESSVCELCVYSFPCHWLLSFMQLQHYLPLSPSPSIFPAVAAVLLIWPKLTLPCPYID